NANTRSVAHANTVEGKNCVVASCHLGGANPWVFGGTVFSDTAGSQTVAQAEVRIVNGTTEVARAYTDQNGNFWFESAQLTIPAGARVGVRTPAGSRIMATPLQPGDGGCNADGCHGAGMRIFAP
ncbi:MAG TPA: hypothetical protein VM580_24550, partial [Labilithrix sp.]|nr:hypothetical protein [Labilithrix sp.]